MMLSRLKIHYLFISILMSSWVFQSNAWFEEENACLDPVYHLPSGSYLTQLKSRCEVGDGAAITCVHKAVEYDAENDILTLPGLKTQWLRGIIDTPLTVVMKDACHWAGKGFDIVLEDGKPSSSIFPRYNGSLLLKPAPGSYIPGLSELSSLAHKDWRDHNFGRAVEGMRQDCLDIHWNLLDQDISASCPVSGHYETLTLDNAFSCVAEGLDIVFVRNELYCLNTAQSPGIAVGQSLINEANKQNYFGSYRIPDCSTVKTSFRSIKARL